MENNNWISVSSGLYPDDNEYVQVTFIGYNDGLPHCKHLHTDVKVNGIGH